FLPGTGDLIHRRSETDPTLRSDFLQGGIGAAQTAKRIGPLFGVEEFTEGIADNFCRRLVFLSRDDIEVLIRKRALEGCFTWKGNAVGSGLRFSSPWMIDMICGLAVISPTLAALTYGAAVVLGAAADFMQRELKQWQTTKRTRCL